eukprot:CAMPEP_0115151316 /NCGR_PEP_ID=MMETSP0227-20121206/65527_1 /TAXON_ID=89957 /ORGANISM="Polarella glacialis, Strain CCMP 1383" /LENGTH=628 /DNA_ID=CAMNT_0002561779 /DNA_START=164 /DNA_END=2051 /DNA_ORIENTATION=-
MVSGRVSTPGVEVRKSPFWHFSVLFEAATVDKEAGTLCGWAAFFNIRVICHERRPCKDRYAGCKEYSWRVSRRFSDFQDLEEGLRAANVLPVSVVMPRKTFWRHLYPTDEFVQQRSEELHQFLDAALTASAARAAAEPDLFSDLADISPVLPVFLGMKEANEVPSSGRFWAPPVYAEERHAALVHTLDRGVYVWGHLDAGSPTGTRLTRFDRQANLGDLKGTHAEARFPAPAAAKEKQPRRKNSSDMNVETILETFDINFETSFVRGISAESFITRSDPPSVFSSPTGSRLPSPVASPAQSRCTTPPRERKQSFGRESDETMSFTSTSTVDTEQCETPLSRQISKKPPSKAVWLEVDLDNEWTRAKEYKTWWDRVLQEHGMGVTVVRGASRVDSMTTAKQQALDREEARRKAIVEFEKAAAIFRELSVMHEDLHTILGYGVEGKTLVIVQQAAPSCCGLRKLLFTSSDHEQRVPHDHISPESFLIEEGPLGPQARLAWTPGQRRPEGHASATLGFKGPGCGGPAGDIWSLACVILVWYIGFDPVPHPWTQFAKATRLQQEIHGALAQNPPTLPKALLDLHLAAAAADEPCHTFLSLLAQLLTRCLIWDPAERPTATELLQSRFFEQAL